MEMDVDRTDGAPMRLLAGLLVLLVLLVAGGVVLGTRWAQASETEDRYDAVLDAARAEALAFTTLDHRTVEEDTQRVLDGATGAFERQFRSSLDQLTALATENESVSTGKVLSAGVVSADEDSARVIVVADSTVSNVNTPSPQPRHYRIQLDLVRQGDTWLTSDLQFVS
jgi:Mce-associated membrane protein